MSGYCWLLLGLDPTDDKTLIKKAFASKLKVTKPEDDPEGYQLLREAYSEALKEASGKTNQENDSSFQPEENEVPEFDSNFKSGNSGSDFSGFPSDKKLDDEKDSDFQDDEDFEDDSEEEYHSHYDENLRPVEEKESSDDSLEDEIEKIIQLRMKLGASQNKFSHAIPYIYVHEVNWTQAEEESTKPFGKQFRYSREDMN